MDTVATFLLREIDPEASESTAMGKLEFVAAGLCGLEPEEVLLYSAGRFLHPMLTVSDLGLSAESEIETRGGGKSYHATLARWKHVQDVIAVKGKVAAGIEKAVENLAKRAAKGSGDEDAPSLMVRTLTRRWRPCCWRWR